MSISTVGDYDLRRRGKAHNFISQETLTQSTATTVQDLNNTADQHVLGGGPATGIFLNRYRLGTTNPVAYVGQIREVLLLATGEAYLNYANPTATGAWVFNATDAFMQFKFLAGKWRVIANSGCTTATQTY